MTEFWRGRLRVIVGALAGQVFIVWLATMLWFHVTTDYCLVAAMACVPTVFSIACVVGRMTRFPRGAIVRIGIAMCVGAIAVGITQSFFSDSMAGSVRLVDDWFPTPERQELPPSDLVPSLGQAVRAGLAMAPAALAGCIAIELCLAVLVGRKRRRNCFGAYCFFSLVLVIGAIYYIGLIRVTLMHTGQVLDTLSEWPGNLDIALLFTHSFVLISLAYAILAESLFEALSVE